MLFLLAMHMLSLLLLERSLFTRKLGF